MSLVFYITPRSVRVQKYQLEFTFQLPPENLTHAALGAYSLLRQSASIQTDSTREEREEALTLLKHYGKALFDAITPPELIPHIHKEGGIFIYSVYPVVINLPWELLYDGASFLSMTQGVARIHEAKPTLLTMDNRQPKGPLKVSLNAYMPLLPNHKNWKSADPLAAGNRFVTPVEELPGEELLASDQLRFQVSGNCSPESLRMALERDPDIFFFSGYHTPDGWMVDRDHDNYSDLNWFRCQLQPALKTAVERGLKLLILHTSDLIDPKNKKLKENISHYFDQGIPYIITISGRMARHRLKLYFRNFIAALSHGDSILKAHRFAVNKISTALPLAWDWSWIQLHINKRILEDQAELPELKFKLEKPNEKSRSHLFFRDNDFINNHRRFSGDYHLLKKLTQQLLKKETRGIISLETRNGFYHEEYLQEFFRRLAAERRFNLSVLYYNEYRFSNQLDPMLNIGRQQFSSLYDLYDSGRYYEESLIKICENLDREEHNRYLVIYYPPETVDYDLDQWLKEKQQDGWKIIFLSTDKAATELPITRLKCDTISLFELVCVFEETLPENWVKTLGNGLPKQMENIALLQLVKNYDYPYLTDLFCTGQQNDILWESTFSTIIPTLSLTRSRLFITLFLMRVKCSESFLNRLFSDCKIQPDLLYLNRIHLIDRNLKGDKYWVPSHLVQQIERYQLIPRKKLENIGLEVLQRYIPILDGRTFPLKTEVMGFQVVVNRLLQFELIEEPLLRLLQFCKKLGDCVSQLPMVFIRKLLMSLEISFIRSEQVELRKVLLNIAGILEKMPYVSQTIDVYRWLLKKEEKQKNWQNVADLQKKLALIYVKIGEKEKAIGLLTSAIQLNRDIKNFVHRYNNLISITLLLLDIGETEKAAKLVGNTDFNVEVLSQENIDLLWLIDGHLLYAEKKFPEALLSFSKISNLAALQLEESLLTKTYLMLTRLYRTEGKLNESLAAQEQAAMACFRSGNLEQAGRIYQDLYDHYIALDNVETALRYLEQLFEIYKREDDHVKIKDIAHTLGGLYFKIGDQIKSIHFYELAQSV